MELSGRSASVDLLPSGSFCLNMIMKNNALRKFATRSRFHRFGVGISLCAFIAVTASAHKVVVHEQITRHAVLSAKASSTNYQRLLKVMSPTGSELYTFNGEGRSAMGWVIEGSAREDAGCPRKCWRKPVIQPFQRPTGGHGPVEFSSGREARTLRA